jgi:hypothetical protein
LLDAHTALQFPGTAKEIAVAIAGFDARAGVGAVAGAQRHLIRRTLADMHQYRRTHPPILTGGQAIAYRAAIEGNGH